MINCDTCQEHHPSNEEIPLHQQIETLEPKQYLAADLWYLQGRDILVMRLLCKIYMDQGAT